MKVVDATSVDQQALVEGRLYPALHLLRAMAAISIFSGHWSELYIPQLWPQGQIAIDVFFMIEGFLAMRLLVEGHGRVPARRQIVARFVQVYPIYAIALVIGFCAFAPQALANEEGWTIANWLAAFVAGLLLLPTFSTTLVHGSVFPLNPPSWAIVQELIGFVLLAATQSRRSAPILLIWGGSVLLFILLAALWHDPNAGWGTLHFWGGFPRMIFALFGGALLFSVYARIEGAIPKLSPLWIAAGFVAMHLPTLRFVAWPLFAFAVPILITLTASSRQPDWSQIAGIWGARYALPIYILSYPITMVWREALPGYQLPTTSPPEIALDFFLVFGSLLIASIAIGRVQARLSRRRENFDCVAAS